MAYDVTMRIRITCLLAVAIFSVIILTTLTSGVPSSPSSPAHSSPSPILLLFLPFSFAQEEIVPFETRLENQLSNQSLSSSSSSATATADTTTNTNTSFANDPSVLEMPRNVIVQQIQSNNQTVSQLFNDSILGIEESTRQTQENLSEIRSILK